MLQMLDMLTEFLAHALLLANKATAVAESVSFCCVLQHILYYSY